jgi:VWFA-related protein
MLAAVLLLALQQPQTPVFRGSTEVVVVDVQIIDRSGAPVDSLKAEDFSLKVDGKGRPIASANFWRLSDRAAAMKAEAAFSTIGMANPVDAESFVLFVVDPANMRPEPSRILFDQAADFMAKLEPAHSVGLLVAPERRLRVPFGVMRQPVAAALRQQVGILRGQGTRAELFGTINSIQNGIDALRDVDGRRTLVYFGDHFPGDQTEELRQYVDPLALQANLADVAIYAVASDSLVIPSVSERLSSQRQPPPGGEYGGLRVLAESTGGKLFRRAVTGAIVLPQLARALSAHYVLTFNVESADKDGKSHKIDVKVNMKDVDVRFRKEFAR